MDFYIGVLKKFKVFTGRSDRREFWMFVLYNFIVGFVLGILSSIPALGWIFRIVSVLFTLAIIVPGIAVGIRRLHDTNRSGWFLLLSLIPLVGAIILIVFCVQEGTPGENKYGANPKRT
jgi:uncharacterized membrane protein YhaH (DUF805 family)